MILRILLLFYLVNCTLCNDLDSLEIEQNDHDHFGGNCEVDSMAVYKVTLEGRWSQEIFPKHYPQTRPRAHFSKTFGLTHNKNFTLFKVGELVSDEMKVFCKSADSEAMENDLKYEMDIFDEFNIPKLENPIDKVESRLFVQSNYSSVSIVTKLMPSPDWFIGFESLQLCRDNLWVEKMSLEAFPFDCGIGKGLTFSAPFWESKPEPISRITSKYPSHYASSFYYEDKKNLPPIAYYRLQKIKEYVGVKEKSVKRIHQKYRRHDERHHIRRRLNLNQIEDELLMTNSHINEDASKTLQKTFSDSYYDSTDCIVSDWNEWTNCSKTCGLGEMFRNRSIIKSPRQGGQPCPQLTERRWCGSSRCKPSLINENISQSSYFKW